MRADTVVSEASCRHPLTPSLFRVVGHRVETADVTTLELSSETGPGVRFAPGQFHMLTAFGLGEAAISISSAPSDRALAHTIRDVGPVTHALCQTPVGGLVGLRGPYGRGWRIGTEERQAPTDYVVVAGGVGLAPLRGAVRHLFGLRQEGDRLFVLVGARSPAQILFAGELEAWRQSGEYVELTVDVARPGWTGSVGVVTGLVSEAPFLPERVSALLCGPEVMMRLVARALVDRGVGPDRIQLSLERNMQCGCGICGHCQLGPLVLCQDGPVVTYGGTVAGLLAERQR